MSQPKRWSQGLKGMSRNKAGPWVKWDDYAALVQQGIRDHGDWRSKLNFLEADYKAEIARLAAENERLKAKPPLSDNPTWQAIGAYAEAKEEIARLTAENERLRKAGDDLAHELHSCEPDEQIILITRWNAAKEGRDAK